MFRHKKTIIPFLIIELLSNFNVHVYYASRWVGVQIDSDWKVRDGHKNYYPQLQLPPLGYKNYRSKNLSEIAFIGEGRSNIHNTNDGSVNGNLYYSKKMST